LSGTERGQILLKAGQLIRENVEDLARNEVLDNGKPIWEARMDMDTVIGCLEYYGGIASSIVGQHVKLPNGSFAIVSKDPLGVVGGIGAWNYPLQTATWKIAPALACGNTFVYKPSQLTPLTVVMLAEVIFSSVADLRKF
jgi:aldehyde dehydrogenase family 9 protein A1